jgi:hypothetical protein
MVALGIIDVRKKKHIAIWRFKSIVEDSGGDE